MRAEARRETTEVGSPEARIAPDPLTVVLPALSALGSVASIAAVLWVAQERGEGKARPRRKAGVAVRDLESDCMVLQEVFRRLVRMHRGSGEHAVLNAPFKFGLHGLALASNAYALHQALTSDVSRVLASTCQNVFDVVCAIEDESILAPEEVFYGFGDAQERLNKLVAGRASLKVCIDQGAAIADQLAGLVRELKKHVAV